MQRSAHQIEEYRLPKGTDERLQLATSIGADGWTLLHLVADEATPEWRRELPALRTLHHMWDQQYDPLEAGGTWRQEAARYLIRSPDDLDAQVVVTSHDE